MSGKMFSQGECHLVPVVQEADEALHMPTESVLVEPPQSDVEKVVLTEAPSIARKIVAKIQLGKIRFHVTGSSLPGRHFKFDFLRHHRRLFAIPIAHPPRHRTKMPAGPHQHSCADRPVDDPAPVVGRFDAGDGSPFAEFGSRSPPQVLIKFTSPYAITHGMVIHDLNIPCTFTETAHAEAANRLQDAALAIVSGIDLQ